MNTNKYICVVILISVIVQFEHHHLCAYPQLIAHCSCSGLFHCDSIHFYLNFVYSFVHFCRCFKDDKTEVLTSIVTGQITSKDLVTSVESSGLVSILQFKVNVHPNFPLLTFWFNAIFQASPWLAFMMKTIFAENVHG